MAGAARLLTTGQVARLCGFSPSAVLQWINTKKLRAYSSPGGRHRIAPADLLEFLKVHGMHIPSELQREAANRILIVDDEDVVRRTFRTMLEQSPINVQVEEASSGTEGCVKVASFRPHLLVLDVRMPGMDGEALCRYLRGEEEFADVKILVVTAFAEDETISRMMEAGADSWLPKPALRKDFLRAVGDLLELGTSWIHQV